MLRQIELNTCFHRHLPLYDFSNIGLLYKSHWYKIRDPSDYFPAGSTKGFVVTGRCSLKKLSIAL